MIEIQISEDALRDLDDGFWFYENQEEGLGDYFATHLRADIEGLKITAGIHNRPYRSLHRLLSHRFPYAIFYDLSKNRVLVVAVIDCRRRPKWIKNHLDNSSL